MSDSDSKSNVLPTFQASDHRSLRTFSPKMNASVYRDAAVPMKILGGFVIGGAALIFAQKKFGNMDTSQSVMRSRVLAQGLVLAGLGAAAVYGLTTKKTQRSEENI
jgi:Hypoxia induced protein conserved region